MKINLSLSVKFLILIAVVFAVLAFVLNYQISAIIKREMIERAQVFIADFIKFQARQHIESPADFSLTDPVKTEQVFNRVLDEVRTKEVIRIKAWNKDGTVIFSDDKSIVGQNFVQNQDFQKAISGKVAVDIKEPLKPENVAEKGYGQLMEVYVPIIFSGESKPAGVIEVYYNLDLLNRNIRQAQLEIGGVLFISFLTLGFIMWLLVRFMIVKPLKKLESEVLEIRRGGGFRRQ